MWIWQICNKKKFYDLKKVKAVTYILPLLERKFVSHVASATRSRHGTGLRNEVDISLFTVHVSEGYTLLKVFVCLFVFIFTVN